MYRSTWLVVAAGPWCARGMRPSAPRGVAELMNVRLAEGVQARGDLAERGPPRSGVGAPAKKGSGILREFSGYSRTTLVAWAFYRRGLGHLSARAGPSRMPPTASDGMKGQSSEKEAGP
jgi:hypothetical protein